VINKVILVGNLGQDPEVRYTQAGTAVASFSLATSERWKDKEGNQQEKTEWHRITAWSRLGEICGEYLSKGQQVYVEGKLETRKWQDKDGSDRYTTEVIIQVMKMLGAKGSSGGQQRGGQESGQEGGFQDSGRGYEGTGEDVPF